MITGSCMAITVESRSARMSHITLDKKHTGKPSAGNLHAGFDEAGTGNRLTIRLVRHSQRKRGATDRPSLRGVAPVLDPTKDGRKKRRRTWGIDDESSHPRLCSGVADGVTRNIVCLFREPDAVTPPVRFDKRGCGNEAWEAIEARQDEGGPLRQSLCGRLQKGSDRLPSEHVARRWIDRYGSNSEGDANGMRTGVDVHRLEVRVFGR